jgi:hypothetical protein
MKRTAAALLAGLLMLLHGCSDHGSPVQPTTSVADVSFRLDVQPIFSSRCAIPGCHVQPSPQAACDLSEGKSYANIVGVPSQLFNLVLRVAPGDPGNSLLYQLVSGGAMPASGDALTRTQLTTIRNWIEEGAPNN